MTHISTAEDHMIEQQVLSDDTAVFTDPTGWVSATIRATGNGLGTVSIDWDDGEHIADVDVADGTTAIVAARAMARRCDERSEERRVGKEWRTEWETSQWRKERSTVEPTT